MFVNPLAYTTEGSGVISRLASFPPQNLRIIMSFVISNFTVLLGEKETGENGTASPVSFHCMVSAFLPKADRFN